MAEKLFQLQCLGPLLPPHLVPTSLFLICKLNANDLLWISSTPAKYKKQIKGVGTVGCHMLTFAVWVKLEVTSNDLLNVPLQYYVKVARSWSVWAKLSCWIDKPVKCSSLFSWSRFILRQSEFHGDKIDALGTTFSPWYL